MQAFAVGIVSGPAALFLLQRGIAPDEFQHSPKVRLLGLGVAVIGGVLFVGSDVVAGLAKPPKRPGPFA